VLSILAALGWALVCVGSLASGVLALWITSSMAHAAGQDADDFTGSAAWALMIALLITLGIPLALAVWNGRGDAREVRRTMMWLPLLWNAGGLVLAVQLVPDIMGRALRSHGSWISAARLGDSHSTTRVLSALGYHTADVVDPEHQDIASYTRLRERPRPLAHGLEVDEAGAIGLPFDEQGTAILTDVVLEGESEEIAATYLFDTGASFTTISNATAGLLDIEVPDDAPTLKFNTASGPHESRMVYLPALRLRDVRIPGLLVSVCDTCASDRTEGLLGLNVMREFYVQMDYKNHRMTLLPRIRRGRPNRAYDIEPVVDLAVEGSPEVWLGRVHWVVMLTNRGTEPIERATPVVKFSDGPSLLGTPIDRIEPGATGRSLVEGQASVEGIVRSQGTFTLTLFEAFW
jgi:hypothetical protein